MKKKQEGSGKSERSTLYEKIARENEFCWTP